jgi:uncharacterized membrane protein
MKIILFHLVIILYIVALVESFSKNKPIKNVVIKEKWHRCRGGPILQAFEGFAIDSSNQWGIYAAITTAASISIKLEQKTSIGKALSGPVTAMLLASILTNLGILPSTGSIYVSTLQSFVVKLATPLLLLGADVKKIFRETGILIKAFAFGTFATTIGSMVSFILFHSGMRSLGSIGDSWKLASALTAKNIGGGLNFIAVSDILKVSSGAVAAGLAVDNVIGLMYFPFVAWLASPHRVSAETEVSAAVTSKKIVPADSSSSSSDDVSRAMTAIAIGFIIIAISEGLQTTLQIPSLIISTILSVSLASIVPTQLQSIIASAETLGKILLYLFFASVGISSGKIIDVLSSPGTAALFGYGLLMYVIHLLLIISLGRWNRIPMPDILVASNANIGNAATASAFASSMGWKSRIVPALLIGTFGNSIATVIGIWLGNTILKSVAAW